MTRSSGPRRAPPAKARLRIGSFGESGQATILLSAITKVLAERNQSHFLTSEQIAFPYEPNARVWEGDFHIDISYHTDTRWYNQVQPDAEIVKRLIQEPLKIDGAILSVAANDQLSESMKALQVAHKKGLRHIVVWLDKDDTTNGADDLDRIENSVRELLCCCKFTDEKIPFISGSAIKALNGDVAEKENIIKLVRALDEYVPDPKVTTKEQSSVAPHHRFKAEVYLYSKVELRRDISLQSGQRIRFHIDEYNVSTVIQLPPAVEKLMPACSIEAELTLEVPVPVEEADRFSIHDEADKLIGIGMITQITD